jgi:DNA-binding NtrC family response regulator
VKELRDKVLVFIEDDSSVADALVEWFKRHNQIKHFTSAEQAIAGSSELSGVDAFIVDYLLPGMNGVDLYKTLHPQFPQSKFILVTGEVNAEIAQTGCDLGMDALILKPFDLRILEQNIVDLVTI